MATEHKTIVSDKIHASFPHGNIADRPASPTNAYNNFYYADDENKLYYHNGSFWKEFAMDIDMSNASDTAFATILNRACPIGTCSTASSTAAKTVAITGFTLAAGVRVKVTFTNANTADTPTLNVESTGAKAIYTSDGLAVSATNPAYFIANCPIEFWYDGTGYRFKQEVVKNYVNGTTWYNLSNNGWVEQGGVVTINTSVISPTNNIITFPIPLSANPLYSIASQDANVGAGGTRVSVGWQSATQMSVGFVTTGGTAGRVSWEVKGY